MDEWENWETVSIEAELDRMRDEKEISEPARNSSASSSGYGGGCLTGILWFCAGLLLFRFIAEFFSLLF